MARKLSFVLALAAMAAMALLLNLSSTPQVGVAGQPPPKPHDPGAEVLGKVINTNEDVKVEHLLMVDAHYTWWDCGKSYLCRMIDMLHMGFVDEILFGSEVVERLPDLARSWATRYEARNREGLFGSS